MSNPVSIDPNKTTRAEAFGLWMNAPNPMVTFFKTFDVSKIIKVSLERALGSICSCVGALEWLQAKSRSSTYFLWEGSF